MTDALLTLDFDDTITEGDTIGALINASIQAQVGGGEDTPREGDDDTATGGPRAQLLATRDELVRNYGAAFAELMDQHLPKGGIVRASGGLDMEVASSFLDAVTGFEIKMNDAVVESGILRGLQEGDIEATAKDIKLRAGFPETLQRALDRGHQVHVVSVNWSALLIKAVLSGFPCRIVADTDAADAVGNSSVRSGGIVRIHANALDMQLGTSTGAIVRHVQGPLDKGNVFEDILLDHAASTGSGTTRSVYVGDSIGDLAALLAADFPIIIGENKTLRHALTAFGCTVQPLSEVTFDSEPQAPGVMYATTGWPEIQTFLFGQDDDARSAAVKSSVADESSASLPAALAASLPSAAEGIKSPGVTPGRVMGRVLTVAGSDSGGGAGIQADLKAVLATGAFGMSVITAVTAQNTKGVQGVHNVPVDCIVQQLDSVLSDIGADVIKTGMLPNAATVQLVARRVRAYMDASSSPVHLVVDPVLISTSGHALGDSSVAEAMKTHLFPLTTLLTPNLVEASALLGREIRTIEDMKTAAKDLAACGPKAVFLKGGHLPESACAEGELADVLWDGTTATVLTTGRVTTRNVHGTGCTLASAISSYLAQGQSVSSAVLSGQRYVHSCLAASRDLALGAGAHGPMDHAVLSRVTGESAMTSDAPAGRDGGVEQALGAIARRGGVDYSVYAVTDAGMNERHERSMYDAVLSAVQGGATVVQVREKDCGGADFADSVAAALRAAKPYGVPVIVNDRVDIALAMGAHGVHVGQSDLPCDVVRRLVGPDMIVGVSIKNHEELRLAIDEGADYVGAGAVHPTSTKDSSAIGLDAVAALAAASSIPVVAIGGINAENAAVCVERGCAGVAVVSCLFNQADVEAATKALAASVQAAKMPGGERTKAPERILTGRS